MSKLIDVWQKDREYRSVLDEVDKCVDHYRVRCSIMWGMGALYYALSQRAVNISVMHYEYNTPPKAPSKSVMRNMVLQIKVPTKIMERVMLEVGVAMIPWALRVVSPSTLEPFCEDFNEGDWS